MLLSAKTGTGKTRAAMLPILKRREWAVAAYPTNELVRDQVRAVARFSRAEGCEPLVLTPDTWMDPELVERYGQADHVLVPIDGVLLDQWQRVRHCKSRGETLRRLLDPDKPKIIFTNPDILFLILGLKYHADPFEALRRYETLVLDEFHLYQGVELAHALVMIALARGFGIFRRVVLLSATPHPDVRALLDRAVEPAAIDVETLPPPSEVDAEQACAAGQAVHRWHTAVHSVDVMPIQIAGDDPVEVLVPRLATLKAELETLRDATPDEDYLPAVVIVNSVVSAIRLEDRLVESGFPRGSLAVIRGLSHRAIRDKRGKLIALGTSAIEVGVDFRCDYLLFEASEAASFLQRFGRVGRHGPGKAVALVPPNAFQGMSCLAPEVDRATFEDRIHAWYPSAIARSWFVTTEYGMITSRALAENVVATLARDGQARPEVLVQLRERVEVILAGHAERLGCTVQNLRARNAFRRCAAGKGSARWIETYRRLNRFRTSLPSLTVHDFTEQHRRQDWEMGEYEADLATLLKRAVGLAWNEKLQMLTIRGIGKYRRIHAGEIFSDGDCGQILETREFSKPPTVLLLYQDGEPTPVSDLMCRESHVFTVVPRTDVEPHLDWKLPVFESGKYLVAFDGAALILLELWRQRKSCDAE
jgi:CRISPR-associated helicase Cas3